jgi:hypothetical protein
MVQTAGNRASRHLKVVWNAMSMSPACLEDAAVIEKILAHLRGKDIAVSTSLRPESRAPPADLFG